MLKALSGISILYFISAPIFIVASLWLSELKFLWIGLFLFFTSFVTAAFGQSINKKKQDDATLF